MGQLEPGSYADLPRGLQLWYKAWGEEKSPCSTKLERGMRNSFTEASPKVAHLSSIREESRTSARTQVGLASMDHVETCKVAGAQVAELLPCVAGRMMAPPRDVYFLILEPVGVLLSMAERFFRCD